MRMRRAIPAIVALLAACGSASAMTSATPAGAPCGPSSAPTLASSAVARVYVSGRTVFGCSKKHPGRQRRLGDAQTCLHATQVGKVVVKGEIAAYGTLDCAVDTGFGSIVVRRLDNGKTLQSAAAVHGPLPPEGYSFVASLVLELNGDVGWIGTGRSLAGGGRGSIVEVHMLDAGGNRLLDQGRAIHPHSLRLHGLTITWRHGNQVRSATFQRFGAGLVRG